MGPIKQRHDTCLSRPKKQDTPIKTAYSKRYKWRPLHKRSYGALPEEREMDQFNDTPVPVTTISRPVHRISALRSNRPAFCGNPRREAVLPAAPANEQPGHQASPARRPIFHTTPGADHSSEETSENITSSSMESDTTFSEEEEEEEEEEVEDGDSSLPSPEIFRRESYVERVSYPLDDELLVFQPSIKNSTLLDEIYAQNIQMQQSPNLSTVFDASTILANDNSSMTWVSQKTPEAETEKQMDASHSGLKTPAKLAMLKIKKVCFKSPVCEATPKKEHSCTTDQPRVKIRRPPVVTPGPPVVTPSPPVVTPSLVEEMIPAAEPPRGGGIRTSADPPQLPAKLKSLVKSNPQRARFFHFVSDSDRDAFFQKMSQRCAVLQKDFLFPSKILYTVTTETKILICKDLRSGKIIK